MPPIRQSALFQMARDVKQVRFIFFVFSQLRLTFQRQEEKQWQVGVHFGGEFQQQIGPTTSFCRVQIVQQINDRLNFRGKSQKSFEHFRRMLCLLDDFIRNFPRRRASLNELPYELGYTRNQ